MTAPPAAPSPEPRTRSGKRLHSHRNRRRTLAALVALMAISFRSARRGAHVDWLLEALVQANMESYAREELSRCRTRW